MNKLQFLAELKSNIHMLEDEEQTDILDEYSQHVDMKVAAGMSEAEAIAEFGPVDELIEEILAAYHVKVPEKKANPLSAGAHGIVEGGKSAAEAAAGATKKGYSKIKGATLGAFEKIHGKENTARKPLFSAAANGVARGTSNLWSRCVTATKTCIRWCWNVFVACVAFCFLAAAVCALFGFGFCVVLMLQGYPLIGVTIALLGGTAALTFATLLTLRLFIARKTSVGSQPAGSFTSNASAAASAPATATSNDVDDGAFPTQPLPYTPAKEVI